MEDYDVFNEMQNVKDRITIIVIEDDENFVNLNLLNSNIEIMPIRFSYDLSNFPCGFLLYIKYYYDVVFKHYIEFNCYYIFTCNINHC